MEEQIKKLAEFMGWKTHEYKGIEKVTLSVPDGKWHFRLHDSIDWNLWMLVEARLREKGLWQTYLIQLIAAISPTLEAQDETERKGELINKLMAATLEQRMTAALQVIQEASE